MKTTGKSIFEYTDEEIMSSSPPPVDPGDVGKEGTSEVEVPNPETVVETPATLEVETEKVASEDNPVDTSAQKTEEQLAEEAAKANKQPDPADQVTDEVSGSVVQKDKVEPNPADTEVVSEAQTPPDYKALYEQVMAPFQANGKQIQLKDTSEVIQLMQQGANYTRNMQQLAPHRKTLMTLQNAGLTNSEDLNFLIDLHQKKPEAIAKLIAESKIDPLSIDTSTADTYRASDHQASDKQVQFQSVLEDVSSNPEGVKAISLVNAWDPESQEAVWNDPTVLTDLREHVTLGVYDRVEAELSRRKMLNQIPAGVPYVKAYGVVFNQMSEAGSFTDLVPGYQKPEPKQPIESRAVVPKPAVVNNDKAKAASTTKVSAKQPEVMDDMSKLNDEQFLIQFEKFRNRL